MPQQLSRRLFLSGSLAASVYVAAPAMARKPAPSDRITVGVIGLGSRGFNLIDGLLNNPVAKIVAVCDVHKLHYRDRPWGKAKAYGREPARDKIDKHEQASQGVAVYTDCYQVLGRSDIDAIIVATPDHWHALCAIGALKRGKDVYCEKPVTHTFAEGQLVYRQAAKSQAVFQTGSQQRSDANFRRAVELVRNGVLGAIQRFEVGLPPGYDRPQDDATITDPPQHLDYDRWCGPSPVLPYMRARHHRWWRGHRAYGGGVLMDWIGHHNDIAHWALDMDNSGPLQVEAVGWTYPETKVYNTPHHYEIRSEYAGGIVGSISSRHPIGAKLIGDEGWVHVRRGKIEASNPQWLEAGFHPGRHEVYRSDDHLGNFLECVKTRRPCVAPAETAHRSITPGHLGYVAQQLGRVLKWDSQREEIVDDKEASELLQVQNNRNPYSLI